MPELNQSDTGSSHEGIAQREGLPRGYQMRADSHYVDHLESRYYVPAIHLIPTRQIDAPPIVAVSSPPLVQSIATHGILQPLLVHRKNGRYQLIAGRKRLAAAISAGLTEVPCVTYEVDEEEAAALAEATNLDAPLLADQGPTLADADVPDLLRAVSRDLAAIDASTVILRRTAGGAFQQRVAIDLIQAQAWRAGWLADAAVIVGGHHRGSRPASLASVLERVKGGFEPQARLTRFHLDCAVAPAAASFALDGELGVAAIAGCLFATLAWLEDCEDASVEVRAESPNSRTLRLEVVQRMAAVPEEATRSLREARFSGTRDLASALGLLTAKAVAAKDGGAFDLTAIGDRGSVIRLILQTTEK